MEKHAVIVVGGIPSVGKTSISGFIARRFSIDMMLSTDYLREFLRSAVSGDKKYDFLNISVYDAWKEFGDMTPENIVKGYLHQGELISRGMNSLIDRANKNGESLVIESLYFMPERLPSLKEPNVIPIYIQVSDLGRYKEMVLERDKFTHPGQPGERLVPHIDAYRLMADEAIKTCRNNGIKVFDNLDYMKTRKEIAEFIESRMK